MCVAIFSSKDSIPSEKTLSTCFKGNRDGAGYAFRLKDKKGIFFRKGFMDFDSFYQSIIGNRKEMKGQIEEIGIHFRIATHGAVCPELTHPFPTDKIIDTFALGGIAESLLIHNGVIRNIDVSVGNSDTSMFATILAFTKDLQNNPYFKDLIEMSITDSRLLVMGKNKTTRYGTWIEEKGFYFSNHSFRDFNRYAEWPRLSERALEDDPYWDDMYSKFCKLSD